MLGIGNALCEQFGNRISATATEPFPEVYGRKNEPHFGCCLSDLWGIRLLAMSREPWRHQMRPRFVVQYACDNRFRLRSLRIVGTFLLSEVEPFAKNPPEAFFRGILVGSRLFFLHAAEGETVGLESGLPGIDFAVER